VRRRDRQVRDRGAGRCPYCGEAMSPTQVFCFACGYSPRDPVPLARRRLSLVIFILAAATWLVVVAGVLVLTFGGSSWRAKLAQVLSGHTVLMRDSDQEDSTGAAIPVELQTLVRRYEREVNEMSLHVAQLRRRLASERGRDDNRIATLDWAETQLKATRLMVRALAVSTDSEAMRDVEDFLDGRLSKVQARLSGLER